MTRTWDRILADAKHADRDLVTAAVLDAKTHVEQRLKTLRALGKNFPRRLSHLARHTTMSCDEYVRAREAWTSANRVTRADVQEFDPAGLGQALSQLRSFCEEDWQARLTAPSADAVSWTATAPLTNAWKTRLEQVRDVETRTLAVDQARQEVKRVVTRLGYVVTDGKLGGVLREFAAKQKISAGEYSLYDLGLSVHRASHEGRQLDEGDSKAAVAAFCMFCMQYEPDVIVEALPAKPEVGTIDVRELTGPPLDPASTVALSSDGRFVAFIQYSFGPRLYICDTFRNHRLDEVVEDKILGPVAFVGSDASPDFVYVVKTSIGYNLLRRSITDKRTPAKIAATELSGERIGPIADGPGEAFAYAAGNGSIRHSSAPTPTQLMRERVRVLRFADGKLFGGLDDGGVFVLDEPFSSLTTVRHHKAGIIDVQALCSEGNLHVVSVSADGHVCLWAYSRTDSLILRRDFGDVRDTPVCLGILGRRTKTVVVLGKTGRLHVLGRSPSTLDLHPEAELDSATISRDGRVLAAVCAQRLRLWQLYEV